jgi:hypothetical protein
MTMMMGSLDGWKSRTASRSGLRHSYFAPHDDARICQLNFLVSACLCTFLDAFWLDCCDVIEQCPGHSSYVARILAHSPRPARFRLFPP